MLRKHARVAALFYIVHWQSSRMTMCHYHLQDAGHRKEWPLAWE